MNGIDPTNVFALLSTGISTADAISQDARLPAADCAAAARLRDALRAWKAVAYAFRDWQPPAPEKK
ncbi:hypothetical protein [Ralstonia mannitolilytica]|uniref:Uncharacterized protein n=1 Tax=Ralstonia mannitolilytica TaxID=105219 RepID=A0AAD2AQ85_9RALS|nr:hypothetical protein [Ralstonia mannitolilytica]MBY4719880.1 hypothetical protein [Ralstonia mannitolilytica]CAJ0682347.1 hypothetical protein R77591_01795 [Ralstonia mannitolilytica]CAJ0878712.1 hypothetical protein R77569_03012 [Ralstonia mannitolilytica]